MAMEPQINPPNPCVADINGMFIGKSIYVSGKIQGDADRFAINLTCGADGNNDIALHINPRFPAGQIVRNTRQGGWGREERDGPDGPAGFPFHKGKDFGITITCRADGYEIWANRYKLYTTYKHRIPFHLVTHVNVQQDCDVALICSSIEGVEVPAYTLENPPRSLAIPFHNIRDRTVVIVGKPTDGRGRFAINLCNPEANRIHFHFNPRLNVKQIVRNTNDGGWGSEERDYHLGFPFVEKAPFQVKISVNRRQYEVEINGFHAFAYKKRLRSLKDIRAVEVNGDVDIDRITFF